MTLPPVLIKPDSVNKPAVYVLDDDRNVGALVSRMLSAIGFTPIAFVDAAFCFKQLKAADAYAKPSVIILDLALGKSDAIEVIDQLKILKYEGKVLLISGSDETTLREIQKMGTSRGLAMLPSLRKPFRMDNLKESLNANPRLKNAETEEADIDVSRVTIERAISTNTLMLWYQPKFDLKSMSTSGAEAVLYTQDPSRGFVSLMNSLPPAESSLHYPLSRFALRQAIDDWTQHFSDLRTPPKLSLKLPFSVIAEPGFISLIRELLPAHPKFPGLIIEATDWKISKNNKTIQQVIAQLKLYRVGLSIDDVGMVYSAIAQAEEFPFVELKLNPDLISNCSTNESKKVLCQSAIELAHHAKASVCAEGVISRDELQTLIEIGCDTARGYLFGKPQPAEVFKTMLLGPSASRKAEIQNTNAEVDPYAWPPNH